MGARSIPETSRGKASRKARGVSVRIDRGRPSAGPHDGSERYQAILDQSLDAIIVADMEGNLLEFNAAAHNNLRYTREQFQQLVISDIDVDESPEQVQQHIAEITVSGCVSFRTKHKTADGDIRDVTVISRPVSLSGQQAIVSIWHDVTEQEHAREALSRKDAALKEVLARIEDAKKDIGRQIAANIDKVIMPALRELQQELTPTQQRSLAVVEKDLREITSPFATRLSRDFDGLTPSQIAICNLIRAGMTTKDIARMQHISPATVSKHRENLRQKLGISGKDVNLVSYLNSLADEGSASSTSSPPQ